MHTSENGGNVCCVCRIIDYILLEGFNCSDPKTEPLPNLEKLKYSIDADALKYTRAGKILK